MRIDETDAFEYRCTQSQDIACSVDDAFGALHKMGEWPKHLPHVQGIEVLYDDGRYQEFLMVVDSDGNEVRVRSVRNCRDGEIEWFQPVPPKYLANHGGIWRFEPSDVGAHVSVTHVWNIDPSGARAAFPALDELEIPGHIEAILADHSRLALAGWNRVLGGGE